ncbi:hypothetical protein, partial [Pantoea ananatis]|uniref:hypothetical protein n=1 Tax=Pantoea ananas TaxID=553 RepID=UPI0021F7C9E5
HIFNGSTSFYRFQNGDDLVLSKSDLTHSDLLRGHNQYVGRFLKENGPVYRDPYTAAQSR